MILLRGDSMYYRLDVLLAALHQIRFPGRLILRNEIRMP